MHSIGTQDALHAWENAAKDFAVWPGGVFDASFAVSQQACSSVSFLACDHLQVLEEARSQQLVEHHRRHLTLAYPVVSLNTVANFNLAGAWACGIQMAALVLACGKNCGDRAALAHAGRFAEDNGGCGYILKPPSMRTGAPAGGTAGSSASATGLKLELRILAARAVPGAGGSGWPEGPVVVVVSAWGARADCQRRCSRPARHNGPVATWVWSEAQSAGGQLANPSVAGSGSGGARTDSTAVVAAPKPLTFSVGQPAAAVLSFEVMELEPLSGKSCCVAAAAAPVEGLRTGIRWVPLWEPTARGTREKTRHGSLCGLLVHLSLTSRRGTGDGR
eukprot:gnl/TRDRNA2_/TRDRNA2_165183_c1_seq2.p1 gnl/TRDRNA2_/TRDRNA2_165183_c1~~gnl/TRDRNA2_/TRDRNA2_165183_c1_seq2.p1  ORF type:complete len:333 (+),score=40.49 gnl/TRDRNA2_/TRDRNA2_165183_c1_seq2:3-1001(+)